MKTIEIDGSAGEGGGQILRTALSLSCITGHAFHLFNIRKGRKRPGLMPQHLTCVRAISEISRAEHAGSDVGSSELAFVPGKVRPGTYVFDIRTAGSVSLVLQTLLPPLVLAEFPSLITIRGGTHVPFSPTYDYVADVFIPTLSDLGITVLPSIRRFGFYPKGGGEVEIRIDPAVKITEMNAISKGGLRRITGHSFVGALPLKIAERQKVSAIQTLLPFHADIDSKVVDSFGQGTSLFLRGEYDDSLAGFSSLGERGKPAEEVGKEAATAFREFHDSSGCIDPHLADQIVLYLCLAKEKSAFTTSRITQHLMTNLWVIGKFLDVRHEVSGTLGSAGKIEISPAFF